MGLTLALLPLGGVKAFASVSSLGALIAFVVVNVCLIALRYRAPDEKRPFTVPLAVGRFPVLPGLAIVVACGLGTQLDPMSYAIGAGVLVLGTVVWLVRRKLAAK